MNTFIPTSRFTVLATLGDYLDVMNRAKNEKIRGDNKRYVHLLEEAEDLANYIGILEGEI